MTRRWTFRLAAIACIGFAIWWWRRRTVDATPTTPTTPTTPPAEPTPAWIPARDGACPDGYLIKVNESSGIFHVPGGRFYARTIPDRSYATAADAEADGYRRAKA